VSVTRSTMFSGKLNGGSSIFLFFNLAYDKIITTLCDWHQGSNGIRRLT